MLNLLTGNRYIIWILILFLGSFQSTWDRSNQFPTYEVVFKDQSQNEYEGNVVIMVFDERKKELNKVNVALYEKAKKTGELEETTSMSVFQASENDFVLEVTRTGYIEVRTKPISIPKGNYCEVRFYLQKH